MDDLTSYGIPGWTNTGTLVGGPVCSDNVHIFMGGFVCQCGKRDSRKNYCQCCGKELGCRECGQK